jgi:hypothetical protein
VSEDRHLTADLAEVLAQEMFIRSQGWSAWPTLDELRDDASGIIDALGDATGWGGFDAWDSGMRAAIRALATETLNTPEADHER